MQIKVLVEQASLVADWVQLLIVGLGRWLIDTPAVSVLWEAVLSQSMSSPHLKQFRMEVHSHTRLQLDSCNANPICEQISSLHWKQRTIFDMINEMLGKSDS